MLDKRKKMRLIEKFQTHKNDTGSTEVQVAILTEEIKELTAHLRENKKDFSSRRGLLAKVALRHKLLTYLERENEKSFSKLIKKLKLKFPKKERKNMAEYLIEEEAHGEEEEEKSAADTDEAIV